MLGRVLSNILQRTRAPVAVQDVADLIEAGRYGQARRLIDRGWSKTSLAHWELRGFLESRAGDFQRAATCFREGLRLDENAVGLRINLAAALQVADQLEKSEEQYERLLKAHGGDYELILGAGFVKRRLLKYDEAEALFRRAVSQNPSDPRGHRDLGDLLCRRGRYLEGWPHWHRNPGISGAAAQARPGKLWIGEPAHIERLRIWCAMGLGDYIQFLRFVPLLKARCPATAIELEVPRELLRLVERLPGVDLIMDAGNAGAAQAPDYHVSVMSLPLILGSAGLPPWRGPYLAGGSVARKPNTVPRIGLVWAGSQAPGAPHEFNRFQGKRDVPLPLLLKCFPEQGVQLVALQKGPGLAQLEMLDAQAKARLSLPELRDFLDTATLLEEIDLLVTVETSVAHLAGAMGVRSMLLCVDDLYCAWRGDQDISEWYPTLRVFKQHRTGDWTEPLARLSGAVSDGLRVGFDKTPMP